jgi:hypothetical protein
MARHDSRTALFAALSRIQAGQPKRSEGQLTAAGLAAEAGVGRATLYRCPDVLKALQAVKAGRAALQDTLPPPPIPLRSSERELREAISKLANRILLLETVIKDRDTELAKFRRVVGKTEAAVVPLPLFRKGGIR